jgi:DNA-binding transcriptional regulator YdaS (Cro superfamily)
MDAKTIITQLGGPKAVADIIGNITSQAVSQWERIPVKRCPLLHRVAAERGLVGITVHTMRPDIFGPAPGVSPTLPAAQERAA